MATFEEDLRAVLNKHSVENLSDTPDFILASFLSNVLTDWNHATRAREKWYVRHRDAVTGEYVSQEYAEPRSLSMVEVWRSTSDTTVKETDK